MNRERWQEIKETLHAALELAPDQRAAYLERACSTDHSLRREVESLLSSSDEIRSSFLQSPPIRGLTLPQGTRLGPYEIVSLIGAGGMGEVYRAHDPRLGRDVAIKVLPRLLTVEPDRLRRFEREARAAAALNHPNILAVHDIGAGESPYIVSELLEGETLRDRLKSGPLPVREAIDLALQIASGLGAGHGKGIIHRDLKPENLFVTTDGRVKILDFGLTKLVQPEAVVADSMPTLAHESEPGRVIGTVGYMSPEQVRGQVADFRSDIFTFGAILYEMLSGKQAFQGNTRADIMSAILSRDPEDLSAGNRMIPPALHNVVRRCLEKAPSERFQSVRDVAFALEAVSDTATKPTPAATRRAWPSPRWRWRLMASAISLIAIAVAVVASVLYLRGREATIDSIAVMPFASNGTDSGAELGDGLTSGLIESLSKIPNLRVMSRNSVAHYKGQDVDPPKVGRELNVGAVLTGTLTSRSDGFVLDAELIRASDNTHLWGQQYTGKASDVLSLQADLASAVSSKLRPRLATEAKTKLANPGTSNPEAYALYVKGRYAADRWYEQDWKKALAYFEQAAEKDPAYSQAYAGVGEAYVLLAHYRSVALQEGAQKARAAAHRALELDSNLAEAHCVLGGAAYMLWQWKEAEEEEQRCVELNSNLSIAHQYRAYVLSTLGRMDEALAEHKRSLELDPVSFAGNLFVALDYYWLRDYKRAIEESLKILEIEPNQTELRTYLGRSYVMMREYDKAAGEFEKALTLSGREKQAEGLRHAYAKDGLRGLLKAQIELWSHPEKPEDYDPDSVAQNYALLGDRESAFLWLDRAYAENDKLPNGNLLDTKVEPFLDNIRSDSRYNAFLRRMGFPQ